MLDARNGIVIENNVSLLSDIWIWILHHDSQNPMYHVKGGPITIGDFAWISCRVIFLPLVNIGKGAVFAAGSVVTADVSEITTVGGVPAKFIGKRNRDLKYKLKFHKAFQ